MTRDEAADFRVLLDIVRDWREEDRTWKRDVDNRLRSVEAYVTGQLAERRALSRASLSRRQAFGVIVTAIGALGGLVLGIYNALT